MQPGDMIGADRGRIAIIRAPDTPLTGRAKRRIQASQALVRRVLSPSGLIRTFDLRAWL